MYEVGRSAETTRVFTEDDVRRFADITGDRNPIHLSEDFAAATRLSPISRSSGVMLGAM